MIGLIGRGGLAVIMASCLAMPAQAAPKPLKYVLQDSSKVVPGGRSVQVSVPQAELSSNINSALGLAFAGGLVGVLIEAKLGADRAERAQAGITPIRTALMDFDADQLAIDTTKAVLVSNPWLEGQEPVFTRDPSLYGKSDFLTAAPASQTAYFSYIYDVSPDFSAIGVGVVFFLANKEMPKKGAPEQRLYDKNLVYFQRVSSVSRLADPGVPADNVKRWAANDGALARKALTDGFAGVAALMPRAFALTAEDVTRTDAAARKTVGAYGGKVLEEDATGTLLFNKGIGGLIHVRTLKE